MDTDEGEVLAMAPHTMPAGYAQDRNRLQYELTVRQEPKQARMCGIGGKADRRPIDPPVIVQLRVIDPAVPSASSAAASSSSAASGSSSAAAAAPGASASSSSSAAAAGPNDELDADPTADGDGDADDPPYSNLPGYAQSFLQNPYYFMTAARAARRGASSARCMR
ncbi:hypothetical protein B0H11DRAFT_171206 [Mycena galericulata]|nr:hypothetical protein B0H11DRAFT_171206 [Mycena galericulata]